MAAFLQNKTVTYEEWLFLPEVEDAIEEVVNGEVRIMPPAKLIHALVVQQIYRFLDRQLEASRCVTLCSSFGLIIRKRPLSSRVPDVAVFERAGMVAEDGYIHSAPQLAVEVPSPANTRRKLTEKLADYAEIGVPEVWVVSPEARTVEVLRLEGERLSRAQLLSDGDVLRPGLFPHVVVEIAQIWPE
jgi:Uma2 family endonuclease